MKTAKNLRNTYNELKEVFEKLNYKVVLDKGNFNTGYCLLEHEKIIFKLITNFFLPPIFLFLFDKFL